MTGPESRPVRLVPPGARRPAGGGEGMVREEAVRSGRLWAGLVRTAPGAASNWHHHGAWETSIFVVSGRVVLESGPDGSVVVDAGPGDFVHVPPYAVHRETNPDSSAESHLMVARAAGGDPGDPPATDVDGPAA